MDSISETDLKTHVTILGWALIIINVLGLLVGIGAFTILSGIGILAQDRVALGVLGLTGLGVATITALLAIPGIIAGLGLLARKNWARIVAIVVAALGALNFPVGTLTAVYALFVLLQKSAERYFAG